MGAVKPLRKKLKFLSINHLGTFLSFWEEKNNIINNLEVIKMKVVAIVGSIRKDSYNLKLAKHVQNRYADQFEVEILDLAPLPVYNQDIELDAPQDVLDFKAKVKEADAVLWVTPEYNATIPGVLGNAIDWLSRVDKVMNGKPSIVMGTSMGILGSVKAQMHLRDILFASGLNSPVLVEMKYMLVLFMRNLMLKAI